MLLCMPVPSPYNQDGNFSIAYFYGVAAVFARNELEMDEMSPEVARAILVADPVKWPVWMKTEVGLNRSVWNLNCPGGEGRIDTMTPRWSQWWAVADALKNRINAERQL